MRIRSSNSSDDLSEHEFQTTLNLWVAAAFITLVSVGCGGGQTGAPTVNNAKPKPVDPSKIPTDAECEAFVKTYIAKLQEGDVAGVNRLIDWDAIFKTTTDNVDVDEKFRTGFIKGMKQGLQQNSIAKQLVQIMQQGGHMGFLRIHKVGEEKRALLRLVQLEAGLNYHDMVLQKDDSGQVRAVDLYIFLSGEKITETFRRIYLMAAAAKSKSFLDKLVGGESDLIKSGPQFQQFGQAFRLGQHRQVLQLYKGFPESLKKEKSVMLIHMQSAAKIDEKLYTEAIDNFRKTHPRDSCLDLVTVDHHLISKKYDLAMKCVDRLDKSLGGDPFLDSTRATIKMEQKEYDAAKQLADKAAAALPNSTMPIFVQVSVSMAAEKFDETLELLLKLERDHQMQFQDLRTVPEYAGFVKSPEYQKWLQRGR